MSYKLLFEAGVCCQAWSPDAECCDDLCVAHRSIDSVSNQPRTLYYCLNKNSNPHWRESCNGLQDTNVTVVQCCIEENCNSQLFPRLPSEPTVPTTYPPYRPTITPSTTSEPTAIASTNTPTTTAVSTDVPNSTNEGTADSSTITTESTTYNCKFVDYRIIAKCSYNYSTVKCIMDLWFIPNIADRM